MKRLQVTNCLYTILFRCEKRYLYSVLFNWKICFDKSTVTTMVIFCSEDQSALPIFDEIGHYPRVLHPHKIIMLC